MTNRKGVLARVAANLAQSEVDITKVDMGDENLHDTTDLRFVVSVRDVQHLDTALRHLKHTPSVLRVQRIKPHG